MINLDGVMIDENRFRVTMLIDGSITETLTPGTGPDGDYHGSMRKDHAYIMQRAVYSGYEKIHGLTSLELCLPNGILYMYRACSMRKSDRSMVNLSHVDQFLQDLQEETPLHVAYGDKLFTTSQCIDHTHVGDNINLLTERQKIESSIMNVVPISIKHAFVVLCNRWKIMTQYQEFKLGIEHPHAKELLMVSYLLSNICVTLQGSQVCGAGTFLCLPPSLEEYLKLDDEMDDDMD